MPTPLEDLYTDILGKAKRGLGFSDAELAARSGCSTPEIRRLLDGDFDETVARKTARALNLNPDALIDSALQRWEPSPMTMDGLEMFTTSFGDMTVNAFLVFDRENGKAAAFDTGADCSMMLQFLRDNHLVLQSIFITHTHGDHVCEVDRLEAETGAKVWVSRLEPLHEATLFDAGATFHTGKLRIETLATSGHSIGGTSYVVLGLSHPTVAVGDALFAGSMGGGMVSYQNALNNNRSKILTLPDDTVICPGHGPMTTVAEEKQHNPFFAK